LHRRLNKMLNKTTFLYLFLATFLFFLWVILPKSAFAEIQTWPQTDWIESNVYYGQPTTQNVLQDFLYQIKAFKFMRWLST